MHFAKMILLCFLVLSFKLNADALTEFNQIKDAGLLVQSIAGDSVLSSNEYHYFIPASTTKLITAWLTLNHWGEHKRFITDFHFDQHTHTLFIKGYGDPFLVSEEIKLIADNLKTKGIERVDQVILDNSIFAKHLALPGTGKTNNPYDAIPTAIAANFNTINVKRIGNTIRSAEKQTPLTAFARKHAATHQSDEFRINTGINPRDAERYFAELLLAMLQEAGVAVKENIGFGGVEEAALFYRHKNSKTLAEMIRPMMKYSTNFIANQLVLMLAAEHYSRPANARDVQSYMQNTLSNAFNWKTFALEEGAGLSRNNRLSPLQLTNLLKSFAPWKHLLPEIEDNIFAKSGTLENVSTLAGYIVLDGEWLPFAVMMNQAVPFKLRNKIAKQIREQLLPSP